MYRASLCIYKIAGVDPGFWSGRPSRVLTPRGALSPKFVQNRGFSLKIAWKVHDFEDILGARGSPGPQGSLDPLLNRVISLGFVPSPPCPTPSENSLHFLALPPPFTPFPISSCPIIISSSEQNFQQTIEGTSNLPFSLLVWSWIKYARWDESWLFKWL